MKKILTLLTFCLISLTIFAQSPQKINYQAVIRGADGQPLVNKPVGLRLSIQNGPIGAAHYTETHLSTTNAFGLVNLQIGMGTPITPTFANIPWSTGNKYLKIEADITGGSSYALVGTTELVSVPYALHAAKSDDNQWLVNGNDIIYKATTGSVGIGLASGTAPAATAVLDIASSNKGILIPRIALATNITSPSDGLLVYQTDAPKGFYYSKAGSWMKMSDASDPVIPGPAGPAGPASAHNL